MRYPGKRFLFGLDGQNSISPRSDVPEGEYSEVAQSSRSPQNDDRAGTWPPSVKIVDAVLQLQKDMEEFRAESGVRFRPLAGLRSYQRQCLGIQGGRVGTSISPCF